MELNILKCDSKYPKLMHTLVMLMKLLKHMLSLIITLRCLHDNLLGSRVNELLYFIIKLLNSSLENSIHIVTGLFRILSNKSRLI